MKRKSKKNIRKTLLFIIAIVLIAMMSRIIYADIVPKTTITCEDEEMFVALRSALSAYILMPGDANSDDYTIKIPTDSIPEITSIDLSDCEISNIAGLEQLTALTNINISKNNITSLEPLTGLTNIVELRANDNSLLGNSDISNVLSNKTTIKVLNLSNTGLKSISFVSSLTALEELDIADGSFSDLSPLRNTLIKLNISGNRSVKKIDKLLTLTNLEDLNISNTGIESLEPEEGNGIFKLTNLKKLYVGSMDVPSLSPVVKTFYVEHHHQDDYGNWYSENVPYLQDLELLDISYNNRAQNCYIPSFYELQVLPNLSSLYMQGNNIYDLSGIYLLENLNTINLENNMISGLYGFTYTEYVFDNYGNGSNQITGYIRATSIDLSGNQIVDISVFGELPNTDQITFVDLSGNHIYDTTPIESIPGTVNLEDQTITVDIYKKRANLDQYILLLPIMQEAKRTTSKLYSAQADFITTGCTLNSDSLYQNTGLYNVIIERSKEIGDTISVTLSGGIADGSTINYELTDYASGIDSLVFSDAKLNAALSNEINKVLQSGDYLKSGGAILNLNHEILSRITKFDLSNKDISNLSGIENFDNLSELDISKNYRINNISPIQYCTYLSKLNAAETSIGDNNEVISTLTYLTELTLNNTGMSNINCINTLTNTKLENYEQPLLTHLDVSANQLTSLDGIENITSLVSLTATGNNISVIPDLSELESLERLSAYSNSIIAVPKLPTTGNLKYIFLSDNVIGDISELAALSNLIELNLSNNLLDDEDIANLTGVKVTKSFKISGNKITNISNLRTIVSNVQELDVSKNRLEDVSIIDSRFQNNGTLKANNQKILRIIDYPEEGHTVTVDLPQIFLATQDPNSQYFQSTSELELSNCTLSEESVIVDMENLGNGIAYVKVVDGKAKDTTLTIVPPIMAVVEFNEESWTNQDVTATISFTNRSNVTVLNNEGSRQYTFTENGEFTFQYEDEYGIVDSTIVTVDWIDKLAPTITGVEDGEVYEQAVTPIITDDGEINSIKISKDGAEAVDFESETEISELGSYTITADDMAGNETEVSFLIVEPIQKEVTYSPEELTKEDVIATLTISNRNNVTYTNNEGSNTYTFTENGEFVLEYEDEYGKAGSETFTVDWIDKVAPTITGITNNEIHEGEASIEITDNVALASVTIVKDEGEPTEFESGTAISEYGTYTLVATDTVGNEAAVIFTIVEPIQKTVTYTPEEITNGDVVATLTISNRSNVTYTNNEGSNTYTFTENGEFVLEYEDEYGKAGSETFTVDWIDKVAPTITGVTDGALYDEAKDVTVTDNVQIANIKVSKNNGAATDLTSGDQISEPGTYKITATDTAGNQTIATFTIVAPVEKQVTYSKTSITNQNVVATLNITNRNNVTITNNNGSNTYTFTENGTFVIQYVDEYERAGQETFTVNWIDKQKPTITGITNNATYEEDVKATIADNVQIASIKLTKGNTTTDYTSNTTISEPGEYVLIAKDTAGNESAVKFTIKEKPLSVKLPGDMNGDNKLTATDLLIMKKVVVGLLQKTDQHLLVGDMNGDGKLTATDILLLKKKIVGLI